MADQPNRAPVDQVAACLAPVARTRNLPERLMRLSEGFVGKPYAANQLVGSRDVPEVLVTRIDAFDCVTFVETVVALARSHRADVFPRRLAELRYLSGRIGFRQRNHYMNRWIARNVRDGHVERVLPDDWVWGEGWRTLDGIEGYPVQEWRPRWLPTTSEALAKLAEHATPGDIVCFGSTKQNLDVAHCGLLIPGKKLVVRHASRTANKVVDQDLSAYLGSNEVAGLLIARPLEVRSPGGRR